MVVTKNEKRNYDRRWRKKNRARCRATQERYRLRHRKRILAKRRKRYAEDPSRRAYNNAWNKAHPIRARRTRKEWGARNRLKNLLCFARCRAKRRGLRFTMTVEELVIPKRCPVFGFPLSKQIVKGNLRAPSIDRIDSRKGYVKGNVAVISLRANLLKNNASLEELQALVRWMKKATR